MQGTDRAATASPPRPPALPPGGPTARRRGLSALLLLGLAMAGLGATALPSAAQQRQGPAMPRGQYLATIMDCGGCHTQGALAGQPDPKFALAGSNVGFGIPGVGYFYPPNLTPDRETGLGNWSEAEIIRAIRTGTRPDGRMLAPMMPWQSYAALSDEDARALVGYIRSLPPVRHQVPGITGPNEAPPAPYLTVVMPGR